VVSALQDLLALDDDVLARFYVDAAGALDGDVLTLDGDGTVLLHGRCWPFRS